ncbi:MAG: hypothetical protein IJB99_07070, partial [Clostridia bacterium]|nr:hypothetical protein [Clostridia bacterium]
ALAAIFAGDEDGDGFNLGNLITKGGEVLKAFGEVSSDLQNYGLENFGYNDGKDTTQKVRVSFKDARFNIKQFETTLNIYDDRTPTIISASAVTVTYKSFNNDDLLGKMNISLTGEDGVPFEGTVRILEDITKNNVGDYTVTLRFDGNETYKYANQTVNVTIAKAPSAIDYDSQTVVYGSDYSFHLVKNPGDLETIEFIIGVDVAQLDINGEGVSGVAPTMWVEIPSSLLFGLDSFIIPEGGLDLDLNGLKNLMNTIMGSLGDFGGMIDSDTLDQMFSGIDSIMDTLNLSNVSFKVNSGKKPENIGIYLAGAVSADSNYETSFTVDYLLIVPNTEKVDLEWYVNDENFVVTLPLASDGEYLKAIVKDHEEMNEGIKYLYVGYGVDEEIKLYMSEDASIDVSGAYVQIAYILDWDNSFAYAMPIVRPVLVVPGYYNIDFIDENGDVNAERVVTFDNTEKAMLTRVTNKDGDITDVVPTVKYYGIQTNGTAYDSETAPKHAGAYTVVASIIKKDDAGNITAAGLALGAMAIVPAETEVIAETAVVPYTGDVDFSDFYAVTTNSGVNPDMTVISASIDVSGAYVQIA